VRGTLLLHKSPGQVCPKEMRKTRGILHDEHIVGWQAGQPRPLVSGAGPVRMSFSGDICVSSKIFYIKKFDLNLEHETHSLLAESDAIPASSGDFCLLRDTDPGFELFTRNCLDHRSRPCR